MDAMRITVDADPRPEDRRVVVDELLAFNVAVLGEPGLVPVGVFLRDADGAVCGGLLARIQWRWMYVEKFWLPAELRGRGAGRRLLRAAEDYARSRGCIGAYLDTFEFQALPFYEKQGYALFGTLEGYPPGYRQFFLRKALAAAADAAPPER
jgi:GNAT superfamily N-acetyltransferase